MPAFSSSSSSGATTAGIPSGMSPSAPAIDAPIRRRRSSAMQPVLPVKPDRRRRGRRPPPLLVPADAELLHVPVDASATDPLDVQLERGGEAARQVRQAATQHQPLTRRQQPTAAAASTSADPLDAIKDIDVDSLTVGRVLGAGSTCTVLAASLKMHSGEQVPVALKRFFSRPRAGASSKAKLAKEVAKELSASLAAAASARVVSVYGVVRDKHGQPKALVLELCHGTLHDILTDPRELAARDVLLDLLDIAQGLLALHSAAVAHRDIKPANILVGQDERLKLGDLGLARSLSLSGQPDTRRQCAGTLPYMAPEVLAASPAINSRAADVYAFAVLAWEYLATLTAGAHVNAWAGVTIANVIKSVCAGDSVLSCHVPRRKKGVLPPVSTRQLGKTKAALLPLLGQMLARKPHERVNVNTVVLTLGALLLKQNRLERTAALVTLPQLPSPAAKKKKNRGRPLAKPQKPKKQPPTKPKAPPSSSPLKARALRQASAVEMIKLSTPTIEPPLFATPSPRPKPGPPRKKKQHAAAAATARFHPQYRGRDGRFK